ncbi:MAG: ferredoxin [Vicinamibacteria bacterium]
MTFKVRVVERKCIGAGQCVLSAPAVFDQDDDGIVVLRDATPPPSEHEAVRKAARLCPAVAIFIDETNG